MPLHKLITSPQLRCNKLTTGNNHWFTHSVGQPTLRQALREALERWLYECVFALQILWNIHHWGQNICEIRIVLSPELEYNIYLVYHILQRFRIPAWPIVYHWSNLYPISNINTIASVYVNKICLWLNKIVQSQN